MDTLEAAYNEPRRRSTVLELLKLDSHTWSQVTNGTVNAGFFAVVGAFMLMTLSRFGGQILDAPRAPLRILLTGIWGWLGLSLGIVLLARRIEAPQRPSFGRVAASTGMAHGSLILLGMTMFAAVGILQLNGPGMVVGLFVLTFWFPAMLVAATSTLFGLRGRRAVVTALVPYLAWIAIVIAPLFRRFAHLL